MNPIEMNILIMILSVNIAVWVLHFVVFLFEGKADYFEDWHKASFIKFLTQTIMVIGFVSLLGIISFKIAQAVIIVLYGG